MAARPRIAVTGIGLVSALGYGRHEVFRRVCAGERGLGPVTLFDTSGLRSRIAGEVPGLDVRAALGSSWAEGASRCDALALLAAREALADAPSGDGRLGIVLGGTTGGMYETERGLRALPAGELPNARVRPLLDFPLSVSAERVAGALGAARSATISCACASGAAALVLAASWLLSARASRVLAGGVDGLCELTFNGFNALGAADPEPCRPFDSQRAGLNLGEGAGLLLLELEPDARRRGAEILGFLSGWALGSEAHHVTHPDPTGQRASALIAEALRRGALSPRDIDYVNAHGTGTQQNDAMEAVALQRALGPECQRIVVSSSKAQLGHTLGAAGAIEAALTVLALQAGVTLPAVGLREPEARALRFAAANAVPANLRAALSNSFGFGGSCAVLAFESAAAEARPLAPLTPCQPVISAAVVSSSAPDKAFSEDPLSRLEPERSRRFGRASALICSGIDALGLERSAASGAALVVSSAFGDVERSVRFIRRVFAGGARLASPAEFPQLLASSTSGNASLYAGVQGACLTASDGQTSGEAAFAIGLALLELAPEQPCLAVGMEAFDPIVDELLGPESAAARAEGGGALLLEDEAHARLAGRAPLARVVEHRAGGEALLALRTLAGPLSAARARVCCVAPEPALLAALTASAWASVARTDFSREFGFHEALGATAVAHAARRIAAREIHELLLLRSLAGRSYLTWLRGVDSAEGA